MRDDALAPGYGRIGEETREALLMMARQQGLILDPVYTAKVFAGLIRRVRTGEIERGSRVLMVHTGGLPALFAYQNALKLD